MLRLPAVLLETAEAMDLHLTATPLDALSG
jgi:hypothetical protein